MYVYSLEQDKSFPITDGLSDASEPVFDRSGKYLYFFASTDAGPVVNWFSLENDELTITRRDLHGRAAQGPAVAAREGERRGEGRAAKSRRRRRTRRRARRRTKARKRSRRTRPTSKAEREAQGGAAGRAGQDRLRRHRVPDPRSARSGAPQLSNLAGGRRGPDLLPARRPTTKKALQRFDLKERKTETLLADVGRATSLRRREEAPLPARRTPGRSSARRRRRSTASEGDAQDRRDRGPDRPARRVAADLPRGLADQPRLLLRPEHARRRLEGDAREVRAVPAAPRRCATT